jgi:3-oxoacyl-[acyl-carrier-protein] synthase II
MTRRRVKITGIGPVTPAGIGRDPFWWGVLEPVSHVRAYTGLGRQYGPLVAAYLDDFDVGKYVDPSLLPKGMARQTMFAIVGSMLALKDAGIPREELQRLSCGIVIGSSIMDFGGVIDSIDAVGKFGARRAKPRTIYTFHSAGVPGSVGDALGVTARTMTMQSSCCAAMDAIGYAAEMVATGEAAIALCGGTEAPLYRFPILELRAAGMTPSTSEMPEEVGRPFDLWRTMGVVGEGACMFVVEPESSPRPGYSFITGYAFANDQPGQLCSGIAAADRMALAAAKLRPQQVEAIVAWGPGHQDIDSAEVRAITSVFGPGVPEIVATSVKGALAIPLGAAPAIDVALAALGQRHGIVPPTVNWCHPDPDCPLNLSSRLRQIPHERTLVHSHGLGGVNASLILERC